MAFTIIFFLNTVANFVFGVVMSAILGPAEFGRYATVFLAALTLGGALFDWLRFASIRFSGDIEKRIRIAASLDAGYLAMMAVLLLVTGAVALTGKRFGLTPMLLAMIPLLGIAFNRLEYSGVFFRTREKTRPFAALYGMRQFLAFTAVIAVAYNTRDAGYTIMALVVINLIPSIVLGPSLRTPGANLSLASHKSLAQFFVYAKPIVASLVIYQLIALINRQAALDCLGADATGRLSLATDMGQRIFQAINTLPELVLFQYVLARDRNEGRAAAERQLGVNSTLVLAVLAPMTVGYMVMAPTFEALAVPMAYRGDFASLTLELAPGLFAFCAIVSTMNPVLQLAKRTWPLTISAVTALAVDLILLKFGGATASVHSLAWAYSISMGVGYCVSAFFALRNRAVRPRSRDVATIVAGTLGMALAVRPLNGVAAPAISAALALVVGGGLYGAVVLLFDVGGVRAFVEERIRARRERSELSRPLS